MPAPIQALSGLRVAIGASAWATPNLAARVFMLDPKSNPQAAFLGRLFGVRDVALGAGTLAAERDSRKLWLQLGVACDLLDAAAAYLARRNGSVPKPAALLAGTTALAAAGLGMAALAGGES